MKLGPFKNPISPDCLPINLDVDEKWLAAQIEANPEKNWMDIVIEEFYRGVDHAFQEAGKRQTQIMKQLKDCKL